MVTSVYLVLKFSSGLNGLNFHAGFAFHGDLGFAGFLCCRPFGFFVGTCAPCLALDSDLLAWLQTSLQIFAVTWSSEL
jgi:hypothetical protein